MNVQRLSRKGVGENPPEKVSTYYYQLLCPFTNQVKYVGRTTDLKSRYRNHIYEAKKNNRNKRERWIVSLLRKNSAPIMRVIWDGVIDNAQAILGEKSLIKRYRKVYDLKNQDDKGLGGSVRTKTIYQFSSNGEYLRQYTNSNQAQIKTGVRDVNIARCCKNENGYGAKQAGGYFWSYIKYEKYPHKFIVNWRVLKGKPVISIDRYGVVKEFFSARKAGEETNTNYKHISACCNGKRKSANGYRWEFVKI